MQCQTGFGGFPVTYHVISTITCIYINDYSQLLDLRGSFRSLFLFWCSVIEMYGTPEHHHFCICQLMCMEEVFCFSKVYLAHRSIFYIDFSLELYN